LDRTEPAFFVEELGLLAYVLLQLENGKAVGRGTRLEGAADDAALVFRPAFGLIGFGLTDDAHPVEWEQHLRHLGRNGWLALAQRGDELWVRRGPRALASLNAGRHEATP